MSPAQRAYGEAQADLVGHAETLADYVLTAALADFIPDDALGAAQEVDTALNTPAVPTV